MLSFLVEVFCVVCFPIHFFLIVGVLLALGLETVAVIGSMEPWCDTVSVVANDWSLRSLLLVECFCCDGNKLGVANVGLLRLGMKAWQSLVEHSRH